MFGHRLGAFATNEVFLQIQPLRRAIEYPIEINVVRWVGHDLTSHVDFFPLGHAINVCLFGLTKWLNCLYKREKMKTLLDQ